MEQLKAIINYYGVTNQKTKAIEEMSELIKAICKNDVKNIKEEMADVYVMLLQLRMIYGFSSEEIEEIKKEKIERTIERMKD